MTKIFCLNGSHQKNSFTGTILDEICINLKNLFNEKNCEVYWIDRFNSRINLCDGCKNCFKVGICDKDYSDSIKEIKMQLMESDIVIIGTPVYMNTVTSFTKMFFERIALYTHLMCMVGKIGIIVVTTANTGGMDSINYISDVFKHLGINTQNIIYVKHGEDYTNQINLINSHFSLYKIQELSKLDSVELKELYEKYKTVFNTIVTTQYENLWWSSKNNYTFSKYRKFLITYGNDAFNIDKR